MILSIEPQPLLPKYRPYSALNEVSRSPPHWQMRSRRGQDEVKTPQDASEKSNMFNPQDSLATPSRRAVAKNMDLRNMDVFQLCACAQFARDHIWVTLQNIWTSNVIRRRGNCNPLNKLCDNWLDVHFYSINALTIYAKYVHSIPRMRIRPLLRPYFSTSIFFATT